MAEKTVDELGVLGQVCHYVLVPQHQYTTRVPATNSQGECRET